MLDLPDVVGVDIADDTTILIRHEPARFFSEISTLVLEENFDIQQMETLDDSAHAVLGYLLGGHREMQSQ